MIERLKSHVEVRNKIYKKTSPVTYIHYEDVDSIGDFLRASYCMHCGNPRRGLRLCDCCKQDHELTVNQQYVIRPHSISKFDNYEIMSKINELFKPAAVDDVYIERGYTKLELVCEEIGVTNILLQRNCCIDKNRIALLRIQRFSNFNFEIGASVAAIGRYVGDGESHDVAIINNATKLHPFEWRLSNKFGTRGDKTVETSTAWRDVLDDAPLDDHVSAGRDVALELNTSHLHDDSTALATRLGEQSNSLTRVDTFDVELSGRAGVSKGVSIFNMLSGYGITSNNFTTEGAFKMISYNHAPQSNNVAVDDGSVDIFNTIYRYFKRKLSREYTSLFDYNRLINYCVFDSNTAYGLLLCADIAMVSPVDNNVTYCIDANYIYGTRQHFKQLFVQP